MRKAMSLVSLLLLVGSFSLAHAERPDAPLYAQHGKYAVGTREFVLDDNPDRPLEVTLWYPVLNPDNQEEAVRYGKGLVQIDGHALRDAEAAAEDEPFPLVVFSHGGGGTRFQSLFLTEHLASQGFVVIAPDHPGNTILDQVTAQDTYADNFLASYALRAIDLQRVISFADSLNADGDLVGVLDMDNIAVMGHSFGSFAALELAGGRLDFSVLDSICQTDGLQGAEVFCEFPAQKAEVAELRGLDSVPESEFPPTTDSRIKALIMMGPFGAVSYSPSSLGAITMPSLLMVGSLDASTPPEREATPIFEMLGSPEKALVMFEDAGHFIFVEECPELAISFGLFDSCSDKVWDLDRAHDLINQFSTAFLLATLKGDQRAARALAADQVDFPGVEYTEAGN